MKMIIAGNSPVLVYEACSILSKRLEDTETFNITNVYLQCFRSILEISDSPTFSGVFRQGVELPIDALQRVVNEVTMYDTFKIEEDTWGEEGWEGEDGWDNEPLEVQSQLSPAKLMQALETLLKEQMVSIVEGDKSPVSADIRLGLLKILQEVRTTDVLCCEWSFQHFTLLEVRLRSHRHRKSQSGSA
jgi:hypothetical protein